MRFIFYGIIMLKGKITWRILMNKSNEEQIKFANNELFEQGNLEIVDEIFSTK